MGPLGMPCTPHAPCIMPVLQALQARRIPRAPPSSNPADRAEWRDREPPHKGRRARATAPAAAAARTREKVSG